MEKKWITLLAFYSCVAIMSAQSDGDMKERYFYAGFGAGYYQQINLNRTLKSNNLPIINSSDFICLFGLDYNKKRVGLNAEFSLYPGMTNNSKVKFVCFPIRLGLNGNLINKGKINLSINANYSLATYYAKIYYGANTINATSLMNTNGSLLELNQLSHNIGFQVVLKGILMKKMPILRIGYDFCLNRNKWFSPVNVIQGFPNEQINKIYFSILLPIKSIGKV